MQEATHTNAGCIRLFLHQQEVKPQQAVWYIPVDELASLVNEDPDEDYMDITVLTFVGTEKELRKEVSKLCDYYEVKFVQES
jgi:hypothetical protein